MLWIHWSFRIFHCKNRQKVWWLKWKSSWVHFLSKILKKWICGFLHHMKLSYIRLLPILRVHKHSWLIQSIRFWQSQEHLRISSFSLPNSHIHQIWLGNQTYLSHKYLCKYGNHSYPKIHRWQLNLTWWRCQRLNRQQSV